VLALMATRATLCLGPRGGAWPDGQIWKRAEPELRKTTPATLGRHLLVGARGQRLASSQAAALKTLSASRQDGERPRWSWNSPAARALKAAFVVGAQASWAR